MANVGGNTAAIYTPVDGNRIKGLQSEDNWGGTSFYFEEDAHLESGLIYQKAKGVNFKEVWLFGVKASQSDIKLKLSFIDYRDSIISTTTENFKTDDVRYCSVYGVAFRHSNELLVRIEGTGIIHSVSLKQLKPVLVLSDWKGDLKRETQVESFTEEKTISLSGEARQTRQLDKVDFSSFQTQPRIFIGFLDDNILFNRIEGLISKFSSRLSHSEDGPIDFSCNQIKIPFRDWT